MRVIIGPTLPGCASPPGCGVSSKVRVWLLVGIDLIVASGTASHGQESRWPEEATCRDSSQSVSFHLERVSSLFPASVCRQGAQGTKNIPDFWGERSTALAYTPRNDFEVFLRPYSGNYSELKIKWSWESLHAVCYRHIVV